MSIPIPKLSRSGSLLDSNALLLRITGLIALLNVPLRHLPDRFNDIMVFNIPTTTRYTSLVLGIALLYLASQIARKKQSAYWVAIFVIGVLVGLELFHVRNPIVIGLYGVTLASLVRDRRDYIVRSDMISVRQACLTAGGIVLALALLVAVSLQVINERNFGSDASASTVANIVVRSMVGLSLPSQVHLTHFGTHIVTLLHVGTISSIVFVGISLFQPLRLRRGASRAQLRQAARIVSRYSTSSEDYFKLWPEDKHYFFYKDSFVTYGLRRGVALILDGPTGDPEVLDQIRSAFLDAATQSGWTVAVVHADAAERDAWGALGLQSVFMGGEALVDTAEFVDSTASNKHFRYIRNKAAKEGLTCEYWEPPLSPHQIEQLRTVSTAWLQHGGRREYQFSMGYFDDAYLRRCDVAVVRQDELIIAYTNRIPTFTAGSASIDHMRSLPEAPAVTMHYLLLELIKLLSANDIRSFNLGLSPLSRLDEQTGLGYSKPLLGILKRVSRRFYSTEGIEQFKGKFQPDWQPRYLLYSGGPSRLSAIAAALNTVMAYRNKRWSRLQKLLLAGAILAALGYDAFPLAYIFNRPYFWHGLVSELSEYGQPYAWLFNGLDIMSAMSGVVVFGYLYQRYRSAAKVWRFSLLLAVVTSACDLLTTFVVLPHGYNSETPISLHGLISQPTVLVHGAASFLNSSAFVVSLGLWAYYRRRQATGRHFRLGMFVVSIFIGTFGSIIGTLYPAGAASLQRAFIILYAIWLVAIATDAIKHLPPRSNDVLQTPPDRPL